MQIIERIQEQFVQVLERIEEEIEDTSVPPIVEETVEADHAFNSAQWSRLSSLLRFRLSLLFQTLPLVTRASTARGARVLVVARSFALAIVTLQVKFASSMPMRTPVMGDQTVGYIVDSSGLTGSVRVSTLEPTCDESILTAYVDVISYESILENFEPALKGLLCRH